VNESAILNVTEMRFIGEQKFYLYVLDITNTTPENDLLVKGLNQFFETNGTNITEDGSFNKIIDVIGINLDVEILCILQDDTLRNIIGIQLFLVWSSSAVYEKKLPNGFWFIISYRWSEGSFTIWVLSKYESMIKPIFEDVARCSVDESLENNNLINSVLDWTFGISFSSVEIVFLASITALAGLTAVALYAVALIEFIILCFEAIIFFQLHQAEQG